MGATGGTAVGRAYKCIHNYFSLYDCGKEGADMKKRLLELLAKTAFRAAKRADGTASEFGLHQPKKPAGKQKK